MNGKKDTACSMCGREKKCIQSFGGEHISERIYAQTGRKY